MDELRMMWEILDDNGVIFSGNEEEMRQQFHEIVEGNCELEDQRGDVKLVQVHGRHK